MTTLVQRTQPMQITQSIEQVMHSGTGAGVKISDSDHQQRWHGRLMVRFLSVPLKLVQP